MVLPCWPHVLAALLAAAAVAVLAALLFDRVSGAGAESTVVERYDGAACSFKARDGSAAPGPAPAPAPDGGSTPTVYELGAAGAGGAPWNVAAFPDPAAQWIWSDPNARTTAAAGCVTFSLSYVAPAAQSVVLYAVVDNVGTVSVNGNTVLTTSDYSWKANPTPSASVSLNQGTNLIQVRATNATVSPAGILISAVDASDGSTVRFHTSKAWSAAAGC